MEYNALNTMCDWERTKALYLIEIAQNYLDWDLSSYGELNVNPNSGYVYIWLEDQPYTIYMPITCILSKSDVYVLWTNPETGEEIEQPLNDNHIVDLEQWVRELEFSIE